MSDILYLCYSTWPTSKLHKPTNKLYTHQIGVGVKPKLHKLQGNCFSTFKLLLDLIFFKLSLVRSEDRNKVLGQIRKYVCFGKNIRLSRVT